MSRAGQYTEGRQQGQLPPQRRLNLLFLFYFKYIRQNKSCVIFNYIGAPQLVCHPGKKILRTALIPRRLILGQAEVHDLPRYRKVLKVKTLVTNNINLPEQVSIVSLLYMLLRMPLWNQQSKASRR